MGARTEPWSVDENEDDHAMAGASTSSISMSFNRRGMLAITRGENLIMTAAMHGVTKGPRTGWLDTSPVKIWRLSRP